MNELTDEQAVAVVIGLTLFCCVVSLVVCAIVGIIQAIREHRRWRR